MLWTWRLTYLSTLGGVAYLGYGIWVLRHPVEQEEPDPKKKTLVVLGTCDAIESLPAPIC
jgi:NADH:ubiquinone reductase (non-electrogenic)